MPVDDSQTYTGIDNDPNEGSFGNEIKDEEVEKKIQEQERLLKELTPKLQELLDIIDAEIKQVMSIDRFLTASKDPEVDIRSELQAAALYKQYLGQLKTNFTLKLNETKKG